MHHWTRENDRLRWRQPNGTYRGKRLAANCPVPRDVVRVYVTQGTIHAIAKLRGDLGLSPTQALEVLNEARYGTY